MSAASGFQLAANQSLAGFGTVNGSLATQPGSTISGGSGSTVGTLSFNNGLNLGGGTLQFNLGAPGGPGSTSSLLSCGALAAVGGNTTALAFNTLAGFAAGNYELIGFGSSTLSSANLVEPPSIGGMQATYSLTPTALDVTLVNIVGPFWASTTGGSWSVAGNWSTNPVPAPNGAGSTANLLGALAASDTITLDVPVTIGTLNINNTASYTIGATGGTNSLTLDNSGSGATITLLAGSHAIQAPVVLNSPTTVTVTDVTQSLTVGGSIGGTGSLLMTGPGTLVLTASNSFGGTTLSGGTLQISGSGTLPNAPLTVNAGVLDLGSSSQVVGPIGITGGVLQNGLLTGGNVAISAGELKPTISLAGSSIAVSGGQIDSGASLSSGSIGISGGLIQANATLTASNSFAISGGSINGILAGPAAATVSGGLVTLSGPNTYSGGSTLSGGTLALGIASTGSPGSVLSGPVGTGPLTLDAGTTLVAVGTGGTLANALALAGNVTFGGTQSLTLSGNIDLTGGTQTITNTVPVLLSGTMSDGALKKTGGGLLQLTGNNTYAGGTTINGGTLNINGDAALGTAPAAPAANVSFSNNATLQFSNSASLGATRGVSIPTGVTATIDTQGNVVTIGGPFSGGGNLLAPNGANLTLAGTGSSLGGALTATGTSSLTITAQLSTTGAVTFGNAASDNVTSAVAGGTLIVNNSALIVGNNGASGVLNVTGGLVQQTASGSNFEVANGNASVGTVNQSGGTVNVVGQLLIPMQGNSATDATYNLSGGSLAVANWLAVGRGGGPGFFNLSGGTLTQSGGNHITIGAGGGVAGGNGLFNVTGGVLNVTTAAVWVGELGGSAGTLSVSAGLANLQQLVLGDVSGAAGTVDLGGSGLLSTTQVVLGNTGATGTLHLAGGTLQANAGAIAAFLTGLTAAYVDAGNTTIDTQTNNIAIGQSLLAGSGTGSLTKIGAGTLTLSGSNTYLGTTAVNAGTLLATQAASLPNYMSSGSVSVAGGATLAVEAGGPATDWISSNFDALLGTSAFAPGSTFGVSVPAAGNSFTYSNDMGAAQTNKGLTKLGPGLLILNGSNSYTGLTTVSAGTLEFGTGGATPLPPTSAFVDNAALIFNSASGGTAAPINGGGGFIQAGGGAVTFSGANAIGGALTFRGPATIPGAVSFTASGTTSVGDVSGTNGLLTISSGGSLSTATLYVGSTGTAIGILNLAGGAIAVAPGAAFTEWRIGGSSGTADVNAYGNVNVSAGTLNAAGDNFQIGGYGIGVLNQTGGLVICNNWAPDIGRFPGGRGLYNASGGTVNQTSTANDFIVGEQGSGVLNVSGNAQLNLSGGLVVSMNYGGSTGTGTVNLLGGNIVTPKVIANLNGTGNGTFNFNGGMLTASSASTTFFQGLPGAYVYPGGAVINDNGYNITVNQALLAPTGYGVGSVAITASGTGYQGEPIVTLAGGSGSGATANAIVSGGVITGIQITNPGSGYQAGDVLTATLAGGGATSGGALGTVTLAANGAPSGSGGLTKVGSGTLTLGGANTYSGNTLVTAGTLALGSGLALQDSALDTSGNGVLSFGALTSATFGGITSGGNLSLNNAGGAAVALSVGNNSANTTFSGALSDNGSLTKIGTGTLTLSGSSAYNGGTTVSTGVLDVQNGSALGSGPVSVNSYTNVPLTSLWLDSPTGITVANNFTTTGNGAGNGGDPTGPGVVRNVQGNNVLSGVITLSSGGGYSTIKSDAGTLTIAGTITNNTQRTLYLGGVSTGNITGLVTELGGTNTTSVNKVDSGTWALSGTANTFTGSLSVNNGTLQVYTLADSGAGSNGTGTINLGASGAATLQFLGKSASLNSRVVNLAGNATIDASGTSLSDPLYLSAGPNSITGSGNLTLTGTSAMGGEIATPMSLGGGSLTKNGPGTWALDTANTYSGGTNVNAGLLFLSSSGALGSGPVAISGGTLDATSSVQTFASLTVGPAGTLNLSLTNLLTSNGPAGLNGTLNLFSATSGTEELMSFPASYSGTFSTVTNVPKGFKLLYQPTEIDLVAAVAAFSGSGTWLGASSFLEQLQQLDRRQRHAGRSGRRQPAGRERYGRAERLGLVHHDRPEHGEPQPGGTELQHVELHAHRRQPDLEQQYGDGERGH